MDNLSISLGTVDDTIGEGQENFLIAIANPNSLTGSATGIDSSSDQAITTIDDTAGAGADEVTWNLDGDISVDEGGIASYTVSTNTGLGAGQNTTVKLSLGDFATDGSDYSDFTAAVNAAVSAYNAGGNPGTVSFDGTTLTFTATADGDTLTGLMIELPAVDDAFVEGPENYLVQISDPDSPTGVATRINPALSAVSTTINDTVGDGGPVEPGAQWSLVGDPTVQEGADATYTVAVSGNLQSGEQTSVRLSIGDIDTNGDDYLQLSDAVATAVADYNADPSNNGSLTWDGNFLTFTSAGDGPMNGLEISLTTVNDSLAEGPERFNLLLANPGSTTGLSPSLSPTENLVTTTIVDNDAPQFAITGPAITSEGTNAVYAVSLDGNLQSGETVSVNLALSDIDTDSADYGDFIAAVVAAANANPDVTFDPSTGTIQYTAPTDGATMADLSISLPITSDGIAETPEGFLVGLSSPSSSSGLTPVVDPNAAAVITTINGSPVPQDDYSFTSIDTPLSGTSVLANDSDPDGDVLQVTAVNGVAIGDGIATMNGTVEMNPDGTYVYTPNSGFAGVDTFTYTVTDAAGNSEEATVEIKINQALIGVAKAANDAVPSAANPENFDVTFVIVVENLGNVRLDSPVVLDDLMTIMGDAFVSSSIPAITSFVGTGTSPGINSGWLNDTSQNILSGGQLDPGDRFELSFTVTIDPDNSGASQGLSNQATVSAQGLNPDGTLMRNSDGSLAVASDVSDDGDSPTGENGNAVTNDGIEGNDATQILISDLGIAKSLVGQPELLANGNYRLTFGVVVANTGTVDLASLSLEENLAQQFGDAFVSVESLQLTQTPVRPLSDIAVAGSFDGSGDTELLDQRFNNVLTVGDSFALELTVEINPRVNTDSIANQVSGSGDAVDSNGNAILDSAGNVLIASDLSDSGNDPTSNNFGLPDDTGGSADVTRFTIPVVPTSEISGKVFVDANNDGIFDLDERGIEGVEIVLIGTDVNGDAVDLTVLTDASGNYTFSGLNAGEYEIFQIQPGEFSDGLDASPSAAFVGNDQLTGIQLGFGQQLSGNNFGELLRGTSGRPAVLPPFASLMSNRISNFIGGPGPIYTGVPIASNRNPLSLESGRAVTGGYASEFAVDPMGDCGTIETLPCEEVPCEPCAPCGDGELIADPILTGDMMTEEVVVESEIVECEVCEEAVPCESCDACANCCGCNAGAEQEGVLTRIRNWLHRR